MKELWLDSKEAAAWFGITCNGLNARIWYLRHHCNMHDMVKKQSGKNIINVYAMKHPKWATEQRISEIESLYFKCMEKFNDDEDMLIRKAAKHSKVSYDCMRQRVHDFTFSTNRVCDEMEQVFTSILKEQA